MTSLSEIQTPALLVDRARFETNAAKMERRCRELGVSFRPHLKTAKSIDVARRQPSATEYGITVSTVKEAEYFARHGIRDVLYAVSIVPAKIPRLAALVRGGATIRLAVDDAAVAESAAAAATLAGVSFPVMIEIDSGEHRSGLAPDDPDLGDLAKRIDSADGIELCGVFTHAGHSYDCRTVEAIRSVARDERDSVVRARDRIEELGIACPIVSAGSTPTLTHAEDWDGVTEARAGVFMFGDLYQAALETCSLAEIATSVLTTVIGHQRHHGRLIVDAGALAMSKDRSTAVLGDDDAGYGLLTDVDGELIPGIRIATAFQEHGIVEGDVDFDRFPIGTLLRALPNHACTTAAAYDRYHVIEGGQVTESWARINEW